MVSVSVTAATITGSAAANGAGVFAPVPEVLPPEFGIVLSVLPLGAIGVGSVGVVGFVGVVLSVLPVLPPLPPLGVGVGAGGTYFAAMVKAVAFAAALAKV